MKIYNFLIIFLISCGSIAFQIDEKYIESNYKFKKSEFYTVNKIKRRIFFYKKDSSYQLIKNYDSTGGWLMSKVFMYNDVYDGPVEGYYPSGRIWLKYIYKNGFITAYMEYDTTGKLILTSEKIN